MPDVIYDIDFAKVVKDSIAANPSIAGSSVTTKLDLIDDTDLVMVTKKFNSPVLKIVDVDRIDSDFVTSHITFKQ